ncbi:Protein LNK3 [Bienertia sinuspersici]
MTEWYFGPDVSDHVVLKDQDHFDRLPSPDNWMQWETTCGVGGNYGWANNFDFGNIDNIKPHKRTLFSRATNKEHSHDSDDFGGSSEDSRSLLRNSAAASVRPDYYFDDIMGTDPTDDIFLSSLFQDDVHPLQSLYIAMPSDSDSTNNMMDFQSISCDTDGVGSLNGFTNPNFSASHASDNGPSRVRKSSSRSTSDQSSCPSIKVSETRDVGPSNHKAARKTLEVNDPSSIEESVLTGLESVLNQLNDETRLCLRDSMYRLAKHSEDQTSKDAQSEGHFPDEPSMPEAGDVCSRSRTMETTESETNAIDRAVAYMMFNKVDANEQDQLPASPPGFVHSGGKYTAAGACDFNEGIALDTSDLLAQCEVPVFSQQTQSQSDHSGFVAENVF